MLQRKNGVSTEVWVHYYMIMSEKTYNAKTASENKC
jgi:hypothetical protein